MGLETVKEEILSSAKEQSNTLIAEARKEASRIAKEAEKKAEEMKEKGETEIKRMLNDIKRQELANAELENKKMLLEAKKQIIDMVFAESWKRIENLDDKRREACIKSLVEKTKKEIEISTLFCNKKDAKFIKDFKAESMEMHGLIAENKEKTIRVDYSFGAMLQVIKENELQSISKILFA